MGEILVSTEDDLDDLLFEGGDDLPVLVLFTAPVWCVPCRQFEPHWIKAQDLLVKHVFAKVDMGQSPEDTGTHWATSRFSILGVPSIKLFGKHGEPVRDIKSRAVIPFVKEVAT